MLIPKKSPEYQSDRLRSHLQSFIRRFGLLEASTRTPCGRTIATTDAHALMALRAQAKQTPKHPPALQWLVEQLYIDKSNASRLSKRLEATGLVKITRCPKDARRRLLILTEAGEQRADAINASSQSHFARLTELLDSDADQVINAIARLESALIALQSTPEENL